ncbi:MAG TPA: hypothetical protein VG992_02105 [Candidatus Saccharimonadales bacterium]|nr:hypothetical protein [Candidatus Saccharimonadales bacterium]
MFGRVYVNEIAPQAVSMDFSIRPATALHGADPIGFAYLKTLQHLEIEHEITQGRVLLATGNTVAIKQSLPRLQRHIGLIARYSAKLEETSMFRKYTRDYVGRTLGKLTQQTIAELADNTPFRETLSAITYPFADAASDPNELFFMVNDQQPWWFRNAHEDRLRERELAIALFIAERVEDQTIAQ